MIGMTELKPCPFCGGEAYFEDNDAWECVISCHHEEGCAVGDWPERTYDRKSVVVGDLDCCGDDKEKVVAAWNTRIPEQAVDATLGSEVTGETSDGYHTFNELYHHRAVLFSVIVRDHPERAWKAKAHHDGTMYDGMFIVGIETPEGQATYHYDLNPYWDMFDCRELESAPEWDGHTPDDAIARIATLGSGECENVCDEWEKTSFAGAATSFCCSECGAHYFDAESYYAGLADADDEPIPTNFCPNCGRRCV